MKTVAKARIQCVVDIPVDNWSATDTFESLSPIVKREGVRKIQKLIDAAGGIIIGEPKAIFVVVEETT